MRVSMLFFGFFLMMLYSCSNNNPSDTAFSQNDTSVTFPRSAISKVLDSMHQGFRTKNFKVMESFLTEDGLYLGTDPSEIWSKKQLSQYFDKNVKDTNNISYTILSRNILLGRNNTTAMAIEQYYLSTMSDKMMVRSISKLVNKDNVWKISFYSWNFIPRNEDIKKINEVLK